jgi:predicted RNase H-like nuclease
MAVKLIGIDCAVQAKNAGLARGSFEGGSARIEEAILGGERTSIADAVAGWLSGAQHALIALDAPLGWPKALGAALHEHAAGDPMRVEPNQLFRRETDLFVKRQIGKQPLDVGADRIARTAQAALNLLDDIRELIGQAIPLAWKPGSASGVSAIEVYPAATLIAHDLQVRGYKRSDGQQARRELVRKLREHIGLPADVSLLEHSDDALDAAVCVLAGADFLRGEVYEPRDLELAKKEGWIWVQRKA